MCLSFSFLLALSAFSFALFPYLRPVHLFSLSLELSVFRQFLRMKAPLPSTFFGKRSSSLPDESATGRSTYGRWLRSTGPWWNVRRTLILSRDGLRGGSKMERKTPNELSVRVYMHRIYARTHTHTRGRARARAGALSSRWQRWAMRF